jgi:hypothetical protein
MYKFPPEATTFTRFLQAYDFKASTTSRLELRLWYNDTNSLNVTQAPPYINRLNQVGTNVTQAPPYLNRLNQVGTICTAASPLPPAVRITTSPTIDTVHGRSAPPTLRDMFIHPSPIVPAPSSTVSPCSSARHCLLSNPSR